MSLQSRAKRRLAAELRRLARRFSLWADATDRPAAPAPPSPAPGGGPPEHWLAMVREQAPQLLEGRGLGFRLDPGPRAWRAAPRPPDEDRAAPPAQRAAGAAEAARAAEAAGADRSAGAGHRDPAAPAAPEPATGSDPAAAAAWAGEPAPAPPGPARPETEGRGRGVGGPEGPGPDRSGRPPAAERAVPAPPLSAPEPQVRRLPVRPREILASGEATRASRPSFEWPSPPPAAHHRPAWPRLHERPPVRPLPEGPSEDEPAFAPPAPDRPEAVPVAARPLYDVAAPVRAGDAPWPALAPGSGAPRPDDTSAAPDEGGRWPELPDDREQRAWSPGLARLDPERARRLDREQRGL